MHPFRLVAVLLLLGACGLAPRSSGGDVLVIGDSVLAWNRLAGQDVGAQLQRQSGREVTNRAALGAQVQAGGLRTLAGLSIPDQLGGAPWNWVVMNGGANDLGRACGCRGCEDAVDALISASGGEGAIPALIARARGAGAQVLWIGYYQAPRSPAFAGCRPALVEMERRIAALAAGTQGVTFVDAEDVLDPAAPGQLAGDRTHPGPAGSALIAGLAARAIGPR